MNAPPEAEKRDAKLNSGMSESLRRLIAAVLMAACGITSIISIFWAEPFNAQFFLGIVGALCIPAALFILSESYERTLIISIISVEFLIIAYPIVISFAPHFDFDFNSYAAVVVICAGIPAVYLSGFPDERGASRLTVFNILWAIFGIALFLRAFLPYPYVFREPVRYGPDDPVYHMRLVENALLGDHFPFRIFYDAYTYFPFGSHLHFAPLYDQIMIFAAWVIGMGNVTHALIDAVGAYYPAILGACVVFPVYFIGKTLHNEITGIISSALVAVIPGQFFNRSLLGYTDHHVAEVLFSTIAMLFLILAVKHAKDAQDRAGDVGRSLLLADFDVRKDWAVVFFASGAILPIIMLPWAWGLLISFAIFCMLPVFAIFVREEAKPLFFAIAAGISLGVYLLMWVAGLMFAFFIFIYGILQYIIDVISGKDFSYLCEVLAVEYIIPPIMLIPFYDLSAFYDIKHVATFSLGFIVFSSPVLFRRIVERRSRVAAVSASVRGGGKSGRSGGSGGSRKAGTGGGVDFFMLSFPFLTLFLIAIVGFAAFPSATSAVLGAFRALAPSGGAQTIAEVSPLFTRNWAWWTVEPITLFLSYPTFLLLAWTIFERRRPEHLLILVWCMATLAIIGGIIPTIGQNRFGYYFAVSASLLTAFFVTKTYEAIDTDLGVEAVAERGERGERGEKKTAFTVRRGVSAARKKGRREYRGAERGEFDVMPIAFGICVLALLIAGVKYVGLSSIPAWFAFLAIFVVWLFIRRENRGEKSEKNLRRALIAILLIAFILFPFPLNALATQGDFPSNGKPALIYYSQYMASGHQGAPDDWYDALLWMRNNTPDPGIDYYTTYKLNETTGRYDYPESAYGVMSWWDYGHIITFIGHRIPNANPFQAGIGGPPVVKYYDANGDGGYTRGETIVADKDGNWKFTEEDAVLFGEVPRINAKLRRFSIDEMYYDANDNYKYDKGEAIVRDNDGDSRFTDGDEVLMGETPPHNSVLRILALRPGACTFLLAQNEHIASKILNELGTRYVISEHRMMEFTYAVYPVWAGEPVEDYIGYVPVDGKIERVFKPKFWRSMEIRLHIFDGCGTALSYGNETLYVEPLRHYRLVHESPSTTATFGDKELKFVKVFEYVKGARIVGNSPNGSVVEISTNVTTGSRNFTYVQRTFSNGSFSFVVPYSTECPSPISVEEGGTNYSVCASVYKLRIGNVNVTSGEISWTSEKEVEVPERAVLNGGIVEV